MAILDQRRGVPQAELYEYRRSQMTDEQKKAQDASLTDAEKKAIPYIWDFWARPNQLLPPEENNWQTWLIMAGRGFGKTRTGGEAVRKWVKQGYNYVNIIAATADDARDVCIEGESGVLQICPKGERPDYVASKRQLVWRNGAISLIFTADEPERLRGKQHMKLWCDELAAWRYLEEAWDQAMLGLRLGRNPQSVVTTTPRPLRELKALIESPLTFLTRGTTYENKRNLAPAFYSRIITKYEGTRLGRQELNAEVLEDRPGALFHERDITAGRVASEKFWQETYSHLVRIVGGVDPAASENEDSDETGIVFAAADDQHPPHYYVFDDRSGIMSPDAWAKAAVTGLKQYKGDKLIAEANNGGDMVISTLRHADPNVPTKKIHASRGKITRAEPIAALYEQRRVHHVGCFKELEDQMCDYDPVTANWSPDRMDALVWAVTELSEENGELGLLEYLKGGQAAADLAQLTTAQRQLEAGTRRPEPQAGQEIMEKGRLEADKLPAGVCPECRAALTRKIAGGQLRCAACGHQWWDAAEPKVFQVNRQNVEELVRP